MFFIISSGVPEKIKSPPSTPPSGPRSIIQSALLIISRLCSIIITVFPFVIVNFANAEAIDLKSFNYLEQNHFNLLILFLSSIILILIFDKIKIPAALLSGTLVASGILQITEIASYKMPEFYRKLSR